MLDVNGHSIYFQAECCNLRRLAAVWTRTGPLALSPGQEGRLDTGVQVSACVCVVCAREGRKRTWTPESSDMRGICRLRSHGGICRTGPRTGQDFPTVRALVRETQTDRQRVTAVSSAKNTRTEQHFLLHCRMYRDIKAQLFAKIKLKDKEISTRLDQNRI